MARRPARKSVESRLTTVERGIRSLQTSDAAILRTMRDGFSQMESRFVHMETRLDQIYNHVDGFMKLHETLDIEFRVIKEQVRRLEERVEHLEATGRS
jgi:CO dehydrogenase/acetyl-CoA synthase beta subunit